MDVGKYVQRELILTGIGAQTREEAVILLVDRLFEKRLSAFAEGSKADSVRDRVLAREAIQTTGLGNGLAFPHARIEQMTDLVLAIGVSREGVDFASLDGRPCHIICLMVSPAGKPYLILQVMAALSRFFQDQRNIERVRAESSPHRIAEMLQAAMLVATKMILARDIMRPVQKSVSLEMSVEETAHTMHLSRHDALPVVDDQGRLCGEISCLKIFAYSTPDFFQHLQTVSFVRQLDPFEKYFKLRKELKVKDLCDPPNNAISQETTLMEIVFAMTVKNQSKLYVVDESRLVGVVDRFSVIDRILFF